MSKNMQGFIGVVIVFASFFLFAAIIGMDINPNNKDVLIYVLGVLSGLCVQVVSYYFGSSKSSADKQMAMNAMLSGGDSPEPKTTENEKS